jgi:hypothetical protein
MLPSGLITASSIFSQQLKKSIKPIGQHLQITMIRFNLIRFNVRTLSAGALHEQAPGPYHSTVHKPEAAGVPAMAVVFIASAAISKDRNRRAWSYRSDVKISSSAPVFCNSWLNLR